MASLVEINFVRFETTSANGSQSMVLFFDDGVVDTSCCARYYTQTTVYESRRELSPGFAFSTYTMCVVVFCLPHLSLSDINTIMFFFIIQLYPFSIFLSASYYSLIRLPLSLPHIIFLPREFLSCRAVGLSLSLSICLHRDNRTKKSITIQYDDVLFLFFSRLSKVIFGISPVLIGSRGICDR